MNRYQVLAVNDKADFCECCGKTGLKRVVWILDIETGEERHFGTTCAMSPVKGFGVDREIKRAIGDFESIRKAASAVAYAAYKAAGGKFIPHPSKPFTFTAADTMLYSTIRAAHGL